MPPKKEAEPEKMILGRFGTNLQIGLVGLPNVGKSTLFNLLTKSSVAAANFPFCTIDPNHARVTVPDARFDFLVDKFKPASAVPAFLHVTDIAGLVKGASEGQGLGNAFLSHIRMVDAIFHIIRLFEDDEISHVEGSIDPVRDLEIITKELILKDIELMQGVVEKLEGMGKRGTLDKQQVFEKEISIRVLEFLKENKEIRFGAWKNNEVEYLNTLQLLTAKPVVFLINMSPNDYIKKKNKWLPKIKAWIDGRGADPLIPFSAALENTISEMTPEQREQYLKENNAQSQMNKLITTGYHTLRLVHFFTAGEDEVKCWTIQVGTKAPQAAGKIHTDFEKGFICAEVMAYDDFKELGSEGAVKSAGKYRQQGKEYVVKDGDMILFKFNVGSKSSKK